MSSTYVSSKWRKIRGSGGFGFGQFVLCSLVCFSLHYFDVKLNNYRPHSRSMSGVGRQEPVGQEAAGVFAPREDLVTVLLGMGVSRNAALKGLYNTGNDNADMAASWIFENQHKNLDAQGLLFDEDADDSDDDVTSYPPDAVMPACKMVFVVNTQLNMGLGKLAAQVAHAALGLHRHMLENDPIQYGPSIAQWEETGATKIVLRGETAQHLEEVAMAASSRHLPFHLVQDAGRTQVPEGSVTVVGIFGPIERVNEVTGSLQLL